MLGENRLGRKAAHEIESAQSQRPLSNRWFPLNSVGVVWPRKSIPDVLRHASQLRFGGIDVAGCIDGDAFTHGAVR